MPQLDISTFSPQLIWLFITFGLTFLIVWKVAVPKIDSVLEARQFRIEDNLAKAEEHQKDAQKALEIYEKTLKEAHDKAAEEIRKAKEEIAKITDSKTKELDSTVRDKITESDKAIANAVETAMKNVPNISEDAVVIMAGKLLNESLDKKYVSQQVNKTINHLNKVNKNA